MASPEIEACIKKLYASIPEDIKEDIYKALVWARKVLKDKEGSGHEFHVLPYDDQGLVCSFRKPEWAGDHCSRPMESGATAIVMAVCEYLSGA